METSHTGVSGDSVDCCDGSDVASNCTEIAQIDDVILGPEVDGKIDDDDDDDDGISTRRNVERKEGGVEEAPTTAGETDSHISSSIQVSSLSSSLSPKDNHHHHRQREIGSPGRSALHPLNITTTIRHSSSPSSSSPSSSSTTIPPTNSPRSSDNNQGQPSNNNDDDQKSKSASSAFSDGRFVIAGSTAPTTANYFNQDRSEFDGDYTSSNNNKYNANITSTTSGHNKNNEELMLEVTCGQNSAFLYMSRLQLGSKGTCVYFDGSWLTPNEFQFVSGRETAKDWKRSIKHHGKSLKVLIAKGILTTSPLRCSCGQCTSNNNNSTIPLVPQQHLFGATTSLLLQQQQQSTNSSSQTKDKSSAMIGSDSRKYSPCCSADGSNPTNNLQQQYVLSNTPNHHHHHSIFSPHQSTHHHYQNSQHHQVYAGGHTSHHFPKSGNGYFKMADDLMMMKASFLSPPMAAMESPYGAFYSADGGACFPMAQTEHCRSKQINDLSGEEEISKCSKDGTPASRVETTSKDNIKCTLSNIEDKTTAIATTTATTTATTSSLLSPSLSSSSLDGGEKEKSGNDVRCSVTTRDCGTSFDRKHVSGSGKTSCRKPSGSKDEKTALQSTIATRNPLKSQQRPDKLTETCQLENEHPNDQALIGDEDDEDDEDDKINKKYKSRETKDDNNNKVSVTTSSSKDDHHGNKDHHQNIRNDSTTQQDVQQSYFPSVRVPGFNDVPGHMADPYYSMFSCNYPSPPCYPPVLGSYSPFYPSPYFFPMGMTPTQPPLIPSTAGAFPYPWQVAPAEPSRSPDHSKTSTETSLSSTIISKSDVTDDINSPAAASLTTTTASNATPIFNFPWMKHQDTMVNSLNQNNPQILTPSFEATKRKLSTLDSSNDREHSDSPLSCKRFHGDVNPYISGLNGCWPMTHFYYAPHFEFRSLMVNPFSPCEISPCDAGRGLLGGGPIQGGKLDHYANLFPNFYSVPYLHGISTR